MVKLRLFLLMFVVVFFSCSSNNTNKKITSDIISNPVTASDESYSDENMPVIKFETTTHDFGLILQGEKVSYTFKFKNTGNKDLIIKEVSTSCGCTVPKYSSKPIEPGKSGEVEVIFDSSNRTGKQYKTVTVWSNCQPSKTKLQITSEIVIPK